MMGTSGGSQTAACERTLMIMSAHSWVIPKLARSSCHAPAPHKPLDELLCSVMLDILSGYVYS